MLQKFPTYDQLAGVLRYRQMNTRNARVHPRYLVILIRFISDSHLNHTGTTHQISKLCPFVSPVFNR
jgi:hypothetical protein